MADDAAARSFDDTVDVIDCLCRLGRQRVHSTVAEQPLAPLLIVDFDLIYPRRLDELGKALTLAPSKRRTVTKRGLFVVYCLGKTVGMLLEKANPFDLLLEEAKRTSRP